MGIAAVMVGAGHRPARLATLTGHTAADWAAVDGNVDAIINRAGRCPVPTITATLLLE